jgi:hypothetical protein
MSQPSNTATIEAWNGVLFDRFVRFRDIVTTGLSAHGEHGLRLYLDIGCGSATPPGDSPSSSGPRARRSAWGSKTSPRIAATSRSQSAPIVGARSPGAKS